MKKILLIAVIVLIALSVIAVLKDQIIKNTVTMATSQITGAPTTIDSFSLGIIQQTVTVKGFKLYNPPGFPKEIFVDIPAIHVVFVLGDILKKNIHFKEIEIALKELVIIKDKEGKLNVDALKVAEEPQKPKEGTTQEQPTGQMPLQIDLLKLSIGKIIYKDYSKGETPKIEVYDLGYKQKTYQNITSAQQLVALILSEAMKGTAIKGAKIYAASAILGVGFLPAGVAFTLMGKDSAQNDFNIPFEKAYTVALNTVKTLGQVKSEDKNSGTIKVLIDKDDVTVKVQSVTEKTTRVIVQARRLLLPRPQIAGGVLQQMIDKLK
ncbi:MAG: AsmA family protein [Candidatus Omnitrophica bacterium]|nr:AsmA family protein [Candidatus Omnitrophota bacterium]